MTLQFDCSTPYYERSTDYATASLICVFIYLLIYLFTYLFIYLFNYLFIIIFYLLFVLIWNAVQKYFSKG